MWSKVGATWSQNCRDRVYIDLPDLGDGTIDETSFTYEKEDDGDDLGDFELCIHGDQARLTVCGGDEDSNPEWTITAKYKFS